MSVLFWTLGAAMLLIALLFVLLPLLRPPAAAADSLRRQLNIELRREQLAELEEEKHSGILDEAAFNQAKQELELNLLADLEDEQQASRRLTTPVSKPTLVGLALALPIFVISAYLWLGTPAMLDPVMNNADAPTLESMEAMTEQLRQRLEDNPEDVDGWVMLARSYMVLERPANAARAYARARKIAGDEPGLLADEAEALLAARKFQVDEDISALLERALKVNPREPKALWVAGFVELARGDGGKTLQYWRQLLSLLPPDSEEWQSLQGRIAQVETAMRTPLEPGPPGEDAQAGAALTVRVTLAGHLAAQVSEEQTIYIFARAASGPRMPLAVVRRQVSELPLTVTLDDSQAMRPELRLSAFKEVVVTARVSVNGGAIPQSGDLSGSSEVIRLDNTGEINVTIDEILP